MANLRNRARRNVMAQINPLIRQIEQTIARQTRTAGQSINANTGSLAAELGRLAGNVGGYYSQAQQSMGSVDQALADRLAQSGGLNPQGAAAVFQAGGSAGMSQLVSQGAAAQTAAAGMPGVARLGGQWQLGALQRQSQDQLAEQVGGVRAQVPGLVRSELESLRQFALQKRIAEQEFGLAERQFEEGKRQFDASLNANQKAAAEAAGAKNRAEAKKAAAKLRQTRNEARVLARELMEGQEVPGPVDEFGNPTTTKVRNRGKARQKIMDVFQKAFPQAKEKLLRKWAEQVLNSVGWSGKYEGQGPGWGL